ncbi:MAG: hypothetical protein WD602_08825 [Actinomycetota bacterium]
MTKVALLGGSGAAGLLATVLTEDPRVESVSRGGLANPVAALEDVDIAVGIGPTDPALEQAAALAAAGAGVPYVSASGSPEVVQALRELNRRLEADGSLVLAGMSWTPGTTNLMLSKAARGLDTVQSVEVGWVASSEGPMGSSALAMAAERFGGSAHVISRGALRVEKAGSGAKPVFFPEPIGWKKVRVARNAEAVMLEYGDGAPDSMVVRGALTSAAADALTRALPAAMSSPGPDAHKPRALGLLGKLSSGGPWSGLRVDVTGSKDGETATTSYGLADQLPNLLVNPPLVAVSLLSKAKPSVSGVVFPDAVFDPEEYFAELGARGVRVATLQRAN